MNTESHRWWTRPILIFAALTLAALTLAWLPSPWVSWARDGCEIVDCYCERFDDNFVAQFVSTYSNLAFVLVGLLVLFAPSPETKYARVYGSAAIAIGFGSFFYHASLTRVGEWFDLVGVYALCGLLLLYNFARLRPLSSGAFAVGFLAIVAVGGVQMIVARNLQQLVFGGLIAGALLFEALIWTRGRPRAQARYLAAGMGCFAVGAALWFVPCLPGLLIPAHALWHTLAACAAGLMFLYYRSDT
ncbi:MAG: ceramidase domain-containing protein [Anaerolineales bacterium]